MLVTTETCVLAQVARLLPQVALTSGPLQRLEAVLCCLLSPCAEGAAGCLPRCPPCSLGKWGFLYPACELGRK